MKNQLKAPSNRQNFAIYKEIGVEESNADVRIFLPEPPKCLSDLLMHMRSENVARSRHKCCYISITSCEIPDIVDNHGCRFWNIFTALNCDLVHAQTTACPLD